MPDHDIPGTRTRTPRLRRNTPQRRVILEELCAACSHPTASELYDLVRQRLPRVSLGTVYRNLEVLHADGAIRKLEFAGGETRFDGDLATHYHVRCTECGHIEDVHDLGPGGQPAQPASLAGYRVAGHRLEYYGVCPACQPSDGRSGPATD